VVSCRCLSPSMHWKSDISINSENGSLMTRGGKRTISEVQLMHNVREHKQVGERQDWLQEKLKDITVASAKPQHGQSGNIKNLFPNNVLGSNMWKS
uniref:Parathyroid hormone n=1 Tax=Dicentrarchus labrax TaxID=13489 RepID=A0A8C4NWB5_DICLA